MRRTIEMETYLRFFSFRRRLLLFALMVPLALCGTLVLPGVGDSLATAASLSFMVLTILMAIYLAFGGRLFSIRCPECGKPLGERPTVRHRDEWIRYERLHCTQCNWQLEMMCNGISFRNQRRATGEQTDRPDDSTHPRAAKVLCIQLAQIEAAAKAGRETACATFNLTEDSSRWVQVLYHEHGGTLIHCACPPGQGTPGKRIVGAGLPLPDDYRILDMDPQGGTVTLEWPTRLAHPAVAEIVDAMFVKVLGAKSPYVIEGKIWIE